MKNTNDLKTDHYGFEIKEIKNLNVMTNEKFCHYVYDGQDTKVHFLYMPSPSPKGLLIIFHGARCKNKETGEVTPLPLFRGFDFANEMKDISILSISDPLLDAYTDDELLLSWFVDTAKCRVTKPVTEVIENIRKMENHDNLLFFGSSGGGFPAIKYAGIFKQKALLSNSQLILDKYGYFNTFIDILAKHDDKIVTSPSICQQIAEHGLPEKIIMYINKLDISHLENHAEPLYQWLKDQGQLDIIDYHPFEGGEPPPGKNAHHVQWTCDYKDLIKEILNS